MSTPDEDLFNLEEAQRLGSIDPNASGSSDHQLPQSIAAFYYNDDHDNVEFVRSSAKAFVLRNKSFSSIFTMAIGVMGSYSELMDQHPLKNVKKAEHKKEFTPTNNMLIHEIYRRSHFIGVADHLVYVKRGED